MNPIELINFVRSRLEPGQDQIHALAAMSDAPGEDYTHPIRLPTQNAIPAFKLGNGDFGNMLANNDHGVAAPMFGESAPQQDTSIGQLLVGEM